ncbi:MAG: DUF3667 domain-containing protein [Gammaproteobacteria bacterium]|nr:DUF3667 domain-containing protein [Gammaproteobacteria bacterium]
MRSLLPVVWETVRETFEIDGRLVKSLRLLVTRPGQLSTEFSENRRAQYMSPIRMYLFVSIVFFFTLSLTTEIAIPDDSEIDHSSHAHAEVVQNDDNLQLFKRHMPPAYRDKVDRIVARTDSYSRLALIAAANSLADQSDAEREISELNGFFRNQFVEVLDKPEVALDKLMDNLPIAAFVLLPIYALILQLFYWGSGRFYVEHLIFGMYLHTLVFLLFTLLMVLPGSGENGGFSSILASGLKLGFFVYYFLALKRYYGQSAVVTSLKFASLLVAYCVLLVPGLLLVMATTFTLL